MLINEYLDHLDYRGRSAATNKRRRLTLRQFEQWIAPQAMTAATVDQLEAFAARFASPATRRAYTSDLRSFYAWAERKRRIAVSPAVELDPVTVPKHQAHPVPPEVCRPTARRGEPVDAADGRPGGLRRPACLGDRRAAQATTSAPVALVVPDVEDEPRAHDPAAARARRAARRRRSRGHCSASRRGPCPTVSSD